MHAIDQKRKIEILDIILVRLVLDDLTSTCRRDQGESTDRPLERFFVKLVINSWFFWISRKGVDSDLG